MFCPLRLAHSSLSTPHTAPHKQTKSVSVKAKCQAQKKKKKKKVNRPDLLGSKLEQRIMGALTPLVFWEGAFLVSCLFSLSLCLGLNFDLMLCLVYKQRKPLKSGFFLISLNLDSTSTFPLTPAWFFYHVFFFHLRKHSETWACLSVSGLVCDWLAICLCVHLYLCFFLLLLNLNFPSMRHIVGIIPVLDLHLSCCFFNAEVVLQASWCCSFHIKDLVQKALFWALWRHILNLSCHDLTATVYRLPTLPTFSGSTPLTSTGRNR